ncbi:2-succinyl-5-enolpyruvyl-6-hydroxy-3-cyclohexene-1-carboxylate synthase [Weissella viridescens]|uniref:2-succinyl-5-enolpyruvyl-6-hydroxy-3-cyclohexene-1-carboxylate synthase n=1 Tax=Weissella viridescens TaxID=1629 RepID=A0A380NYB7_WEIVI|nr:2-succinyl-5-enolpyruvyl-6-hydroxy-3-cyclohexene-1-carboxylate synthase [Weissella viridescens]
MYAQGVRHVVISPGSRTTPVALLWAEFAATVQTDMQIHMAVDERDAGFLGLGIAKPNRYRSRYWRLREQRRLIMHQQLQKQQFHMFL